MATKTEQYRDGVLTITVPEGTCECGCGQEAKRRFAQGHDARLRGILGRAYKAGVKVKVVQDGKTETFAADKLMGLHSFPLPPASKPKAAKKSTAPKARKRSSTKRQTAKAAS